MGKKILDAVPGGAAEMKVISTTQWKGWLRRQVKAERQSGEKRGLADGIGPAEDCGSGFSSVVMAHFGISRTVLVHLSISSRHYVGITRPFVGWPLSAPSHVKCTAVIKSSQEESWSTLASQHLIMLATEPFVRGPLSAPSQVNRWAVAQQFSEQWWSTLASQHLITLAWEDHSWWDLSLLPLPGVQLWNKVLTSGSGPLQHPSISSHWRHHHWWYSFPCLTLSCVASSCSPPCCLSISARRHAGMTRPCEVWPLSVSSSVGLWHKVFKSTLSIWGWSILASRHVSSPWHDGIGHDMAPLCFFLCQASPKLWGFTEPCRAALPDLWLSDCFHSGSSCLWIRVSTYSSTTIFLP